MSLADKLRQETNPTGSTRRHNLPESHFRPHLSASGDCSGNGTENLPDGMYVRGRTKVGRRPDEGRKDEPGHRMFTAPLNDVATTGVKYNGIIPVSRTGKQARRKERYLRHDCFRQGVIGTGPARWHLDMGAGLIRYWSGITASRHGTGRIRHRDRKAAIDTGIAS